MKDYVTVTKVVLFAYPFQGSGWRIHFSVILGASRQKGYKIHQPFGGNHLIITCFITCNHGHDHSVANRKSVDVETGERLVHAGRRSPS